MLVGVQGLIGAHAGLRSPRPCRAAERFRKMSQKPSKGRIDHEHNIVCHELMSNMQEQNITSMLWGEGYH